MFSYLKLFIVGGNLNHVSEGIYLNKNLFSVEENTC